jgi:hypothetical protein
MTHWGHGCTGQRSSTSARTWGEWSAARPCRCLPPGVRALGTDWRGGWVDLTAGPVWTIWASLKFFILGTRTPNLSVVQPVGSRYTDCATVAHISHRVVTILSRNNTKINKVCLNHTIKKTDLT